MVQNIGLRISFINLCVVLIWLFWHCLDFFLLQCFFSLFRSYLCYAVFGCCRITKPHNNNNKQKFNRILSYSWVCVYNFAVFFRSCCWRYQNFYVVVCVSVYFLKCLLSLFSLYLLVFFVSSFSIQINSVKMVKQKYTIESEICRNRFFSVVFDVYALSIHV